MQSVGNFYKILLIGSGGFFGAVFRHLTSLSVQGFFPASIFPWGTLSVNVGGSLLIGMSASLLEINHWLSGEMRLLLVTGFLGAFTTFSTFSLETLFLFREGYFTAAVMNILMQIVLGLGAAAAGFLLIRYLHIIYS